MTVKATAIQRRAMHLVDLENLLGGPWAQRLVVGRALEQYCAAAGWRRGDIVYIATNPRLALEFVWDCPIEASIHTACGKNGADLALLAHAAPEFVSRRAGRLVIGSGDGIFIDRALATRELGVEVTVIGRTDAIHHQYRRLGFDVVAFDAVAPAELVAA
jgi:hypothetical protein